MNICSALNAVLTLYGTQSGLCSRSPGHAAPVPIGGGGSVGAEAIVMYS